MVQTAPGAPSPTRGDRSRSTGPPALARPSDCLRATARGSLQREYVLTPRQLDVLEAVVDGLGTPEIATRLNLERRTVEDHISSLHHALGTHDRAGLVARWLAVLYQAIDALGLHLPPHPQLEHPLPPSSRRTAGQRP